ncbi:MAG: hypothetical protein AB7L66_01455 [Gemmatimonadales bacterium]
MTAFRTMLGRLLAAFLLVVGGAPTGLELVLHGPDAGEPLHHVEAASVVHHADHCLVAWVAAERFVASASEPQLAVRAEVDSPDPISRPVEVPGRIDHLPASRAPPVA